MSSDTLDLESVHNDWVDLNEKLKTTALQALVKKFIHGNERPCNENDFLDNKSSLEKCTADIKNMVEILVNYKLSCMGGRKESESNHHEKDFDSESLTLLIILCGQNSSRQPWNTEVTVKNCELVFSKILEVFNCKDSSDLFLRNCRVNLAKNVLQTLCSDLTASTWKQFPASVACYNWILKMIKQPELSQYLGLVLPPALLLTDDFVTENRVTGVQCLNHIIHNITIAELQLYGHGEVIFSALIPILRTREAVLIEPALLPLISLTNKLEFNLGKKLPTKWSRFDNILEIYLESMELEQAIDLRNCFITNLETLISNVGPNIIRWSKRLLRIFNEYVKTSGKYNDEKTMSNCIKAIKKFIELSGEAVTLYGLDLLCTLLMGFYSTTNFNSQSEVLQPIIECIKKIQSLLPETEREEFEKDFTNNITSDLNCKKFYSDMCEVLKSQ